MLDPDSEEGLARIMAQLGHVEAPDEADSPAADAPRAEPSGACAIAAARAALTEYAPHGHSSVLHGAPRLRCSCAHGLTLLREIDPDHSVLRDTDGASDSDEQHVWVAEWGGTLARGEPCTLAVRRGGEELARADGAAGEPLRLRFNLRGAPPGEAFVAELRWRSGVRTLHVLRPPVQVSYDALYREGTCGAMRPSDLVAAAAPPSLPARGFGVELELITMATDPEADGCFTKADEWARAIRAAAEEAREEGADRALAALARCEHWSAGYDDAVYPCAPHLAAKIVAGLYPSDEHARARAETLLTCGKGTFKSEFKSPSPPRELSFARGGADELSAALALACSRGAAAAPISNAGHASTSTQVHVNVANVAAAGPTLAVDQILHVWLSWVRFDLVTARFARPWMWREPTAGPLYATGAEFAFNARAWAQDGEGSAASPGYDVPSFVAAVRAVRGADDFGNLPLSAQLERLFGGASSPASGLGRSCSLNLCRLVSYGTLEFRRHHADLDPADLVRWAHFCVCFVERFANVSPLLAAALDAPTLDDGLSALRDAQERATVGALMAEMGVEACWPAAGL